jgi:hypothetical protein
MQSILDGDAFPDTHHPTLFDNELVLHVGPDRAYSLRMYLWGPGEYTAIHDHNAWGVIGTVTEGFEVINYSRLDDASREGYAELQERERFFLRSGESAHTYPLDRGIHMTGNPTLGTIITLHRMGTYEPATVAGLPKGVYGLAFSHDGRRLALAAADVRVRTFAVA